MEIITDKEFEKKINKMYNEEKMKLFLEKFQKLSVQKRYIIIEMYNKLHPDKKIILNESTWYNFFMSIGGYLPFVGSLFDLANGFDYWDKGDHLFAILSWIAAVPAFGDVFVNPVLTALSAGGKTVQVFKNAVAAKNAVKIAEAANEIGGPVGTLVKQAPVWTKSLIEALESTVAYIPFLGRGFINTVKSWLEVFGLAGKEIKTLSQLGRPAVKKLMTDTQSYMGWLDWMGLSNFRGGYEDLAKMVPDLDKKAAQYMEIQQRKGIDPSEAPLAPPPPKDVSTSSNLPDNPFDNPVDFLVAMVR
jgi:hypothetical protein